SRTASTSAWSRGRKMPSTPPAWAPRGRPGIERACPRAVRSRSGSDSPTPILITLRLRLTDADPDRAGAAFGLDFEEIFSRRIREADDFYDLVIPRTLSADGHLVMRQALAG